MASDYFVSVDIEYVHDSRKFHWIVLMWKSVRNQLELEIGHTEHKDSVEAV